MANGIIEWAPLVERHSSHWHSQGVFIEMLFAHFSFILVLLPMQHDSVQHFKKMAGVPQAMSRVEKFAPHLGVCDVRVHTSLKHFNKIIRYRRIKTILCCCFFIFRPNFVYTTHNTQTHTHTRTDLNRISAIYILFYTVHCFCLYRFHIFNVQNNLRVCWFVCLFVSESAWKGLGGVWWSK